MPAAKISDEQILQLFSEGKSNNWIHTQLKVRMTRILALRNLDPAFLPTQPMPTQPMPTQPTLTKKVIVLKSRYNIRVLQAIAIMLDLSGFERLNRSDLSKMIRSKLEMEE